MDMEDIQKIRSILGKYNLVKDEIINIEKLHARSSIVWHIETRKGDFVLKQYTKLQPPYLLQIHPIIVSLPEHGLHMPKILPNNAGEYLTELEGLFFDLSEYVEHPSYADTDGREFPIEDLKLAARELASLHKLANTSYFNSKLIKQDFLSIAQNTLQEIEKFKTLYGELLKKVSLEDKEKLELLRTIVEETEVYRKKGVEEFATFLSEEFLPTHGDFSMTNVLINKDRKVYVVDWNNFKLRPWVWDIQAAISLCCRKFAGNAYIVELDLEKAKVFLEEYLALNPLPLGQLELLSEVVKYNFAIYWLSYTLLAINKADFRHLELVPDSLEKALYWTSHLEDYREFIKGIL